MRRSYLVLLCLLSVAMASCSKDSTGNADPSVTLTLLTGNNQFGTANGNLAEPLRVRVSEVGNERPVRNATVRWTVVQGSGAQITPSSVVTGADGVASVSVRLGPSTGAYAFQPTTDRQVGSMPRFDARAVVAPTITAISPRSATAGDTITITGTNFSTVADENTVVFGGFRGRVTSASATQLRVVVPRCVPTRNVAVQASLGAVTSNTDNVAITGTVINALQLARGQSVLLTDVNEMACQRITSQSGLTFLLVPQNASEVVASETLFELTSLATGTIADVTELGLSPNRDDFASRWELRLRARERAFRPEGAATRQSYANELPPEIGERRQFKVFDKNDKFVSVNAEVKAISAHAIIYQDLSAPANGFSTADFQKLGASFDNPIYDADVAAFGSPSDIDANGKVIILLSPVVNELTPRNASGFISGFFFGCDLQTTSQCSGTNQSEMFYLIVPDPAGTYGDPRSPATVLAAVTPVLAHEFQHMINFSARHSLDALWLSEGLAHMAEEVVAAAYAARSDNATAQTFRVQNYLRARLFLSDSTSESLIADELPGGLEVRGGAWLLVMYLAGQQGNGILRTLTQSTQSSAQNVANASGRPWNVLLSDWAVALWASGAPELQGVTLKKEHTFPNISLRSVLTSGSNYSLQPLRVGFSDFAFKGTLRASSQRHVLLQGNAGSLPVSVGFSGQRGGAFAANAKPQLTILRVQ